MLSGGAQQGRFVAERKTMIGRGHRLSVSRQARLLGISRGSVYYQRRSPSTADRAWMRRMDAWHVEYPFAGSRMLRGLLRQEGSIVGRLHVATLMKQMGMMALYRRPTTSHPTPGHQSYPSLLRKLAVTKPNQVWAMDSTSVPIARGFVYLVAGRRLVQPHGARVALSMTLETEPCVEALSEALARHGRPEIMNTDQGQPVHLRRLSHGLAGRQDCDQHGRQGRVARQCLCRTARADDQIRGSLPARLP